MATIGSWGSSIVFSTDERRILTFDGFNRTVSANIARHSRLGLKERSEFVRAELQKISFTMLFDAQLGVNPRKMLELVAEAVENGETGTLVIGGKRVGTLPFIITSASERWDVIWQQGQLVRAKVSVSMEEYA